MPYLISLFVQMASLRQSPPATFRRSPDHRGPALVRPFVAMRGRPMTDVTGSLLPFGDAAVGMAPNRVAPVVPEFRTLDDIGFIDLDTKSGAIGNVDEALFIREYIAVGDVIENIVGFVVVD